MLFKKRKGAKDFYGHVATMLNMPRAMAPHVKTLSDLESRWRAEFEAYGLDRRRVRGGMAHDPRRRPTGCRLEWTNHLPGADQFLRPAEAADTNLRVDGWNAGVTERSPHLRRYGVATGGLS